MIECKRMKTQIIDDENHASSIGQNSGCSVHSTLFVELSGKQQKHKRYTMDDHIDVLDPLTGHHRGFPRRRDNHLMEMPGTHLPANQNTHTHNSAADLLLSAFLHNA